MESVIFVYIFQFVDNVSKITIMKGLLDPLPEIGLRHRIVYAPCTRVRGTDRFCCSETAVQYYSERATEGGLLITEGVPISPETQYEYAPGIYTVEQEMAWKKVVESVHAKGGLISAQLWHLGRERHHSFSQNRFLRTLNRNVETISPSATTSKRPTRSVNGTKTPHKPAHAISAEDIKGRLVDDYRKAAEAARRCGFDFVEIHGAHGYLFDQFFNESSNLRDDEFGAQNLENRTRALGLVLKAVIEAMGSSKRVAIRISPTYKDSMNFGVTSANPEQVYRDIIRWLDQFNLGYLLITEPRWFGGRINKYAISDVSTKMPARNGEWVKSVYSGIVIGSSSYTPITGEEAINKGKYDAIAFGRFFLSNPDLVYRIKKKLPLNEYVTDTFYVRDNVKGYIDYPTYENRGTFPQIRAEDVGSKTPQKKSKL